MSIKHFIKIINLGAKNTLPSRPSKSSQAKVIISSVAMQRPPQPFSTSRALMALTTSTSGHRYQIARDSGGPALTPQEAKDAYLWGRIYHFHIRVCLRPRRDCILSSTLADEKHKLYCGSILSKSGANKYR